jgi:hypothetical protein
MIGLLRSGAVTMVSWASACVVLIALIRLGQSGQDVANLSGMAILAAEQRGTIADVLTTYPPLPLWLSLPFALIAPPSVPAAALAAGLLAALFGMALYGGLRRRGFPRTDAVVVALLIAFNPFALYALAAGPGPMLLMLGMLMLAFGLFGLASGETAASDAMLTAVALALLALAHPLGLMLVFAALPGLALAAPPGIMSRTPGSLFLVLLFPVVFMLGSFAYVRWILGAGPLEFLSAATGVVQAGERGEPMRLGLFALQMAPALVLAAPLPIAFVIWSRKRTAQLFPALGLISVVVLAGVLQILLRGHADLALLLAMILPVVGACAAHAALQRTWLILLLLLAGLVGGWTISLTPGMVGSQPLLSLNLQPAPPHKRGDRLGAALCGKAGVLIDTGAYPDLVQLCGTARGIIAAGEAEYDLQLLSHRLTSPFILVAGPEARSDIDRVSNAFPDLYDRGARGYVLIYNAAGWRLYARLSGQPVS